MKRDYDLIRDILLAVEQAVPTDEESALNELVVKEGKDRINFHLALLIEAGYLEGIDITSSNSFYREYIVQRLTWDGHEFLDSARDNSVWKSAKTKISGLTSVSIEVLKSILIEIAKSELGL